MESKKIKIIRAMRQRLGITFVIMLLLLLANDSFSTEQNVHRRVRGSEFPPPLMSYDKGEFRITGRGGGLRGGVVMSRDILAIALGIDGKYPWVSPMHGPERGGGPSESFGRFNSTEKVKNKGDVISPDMVLIFDMTLMDESLKGLKSDGVVVANGKIDSDDHKRLKGRMRWEQRVFMVPAEDIVKKIGGLEFINTVMLGAFVAVTGIVKLESLIEAIKKQLSHLPEAVLERNIEAAKKAYLFILENYR